MLTLKKVDLGYCIICHCPTIIGYFRVEGWRHEFCICALCLEKIAQEIDEQGAKLLLEKPV